jgi:hypothetical protein
MRRGLAVDDGGGARGNEMIALALVSRRRSGDEGLIMVGFCSFQMSSDSLF